MYDLKAAKMNVKRTLNRNFIHYKFELDHNAAEATKSICCEKDKGTVDCNTVSRGFKKFCSSWKNLDDQANLGQSKSVDSEDFKP